MGDKKLYVKNLQGDIMRIVDENGNNVAIYAYDQWGKHTQMRKPSSVNTDLVNYNPFLYRGYVYDSDSGLYYLQSRYYDPTTGRFLNADVYCDTGNSVLGTNMFAYCTNNSVNFIDPRGDECYRNWYTFNPRTGSYYARSIVNVWNSNYIFVYSAKKKTDKLQPYIYSGIINFPFAGNPYWSVLWRGGGIKLAEAIYRMGKYMGSYFLLGRTIGGINTELQLHYAAYLLGIMKDHAEIVDIGGTWWWRPGFDSNAWFFETVNAAKILTKINFNNIWGAYSLIRRIARYL